MNDYLVRHGKCAQEIALELRRRADVVVGDVRFLDWSAFHHRSVKRMGLGSWKPRSPVLQSTLKSLRLAFSVWERPGVRSSSETPAGPLADGGAGA